jgi:hypothetical protein
VRKQTRSWSRGKRFESARRLYTLPIDKPTTAPIVEFYGSMRATNKVGSATPLLRLLRCNISSVILSFGTSRILSECPFSLRVQIAILFS